MCCVPEFMPFSRYLIFSLRIWHNFFIALFFQISLNNKSCVHSICYKYNMFVCVLDNTSYIIMIVLSLHATLLNIKYNFTWDRRLSAYLTLFLSEICIILTLDLFFIPFNSRDCNFVYNLLTNGNYLITY